jgi:hypothetical protein
MKPTIIRTEVALESTRMIKVRDLLD